MVFQDQDVMADEQAIEDMSREERDAEEAYRDEQRRMWSIGTAVNLALSLARIAPNATPLNVTLTAEEICEFIQSGKARTAPVSRRTQ